MRAILLTKTFDEPISQEVDVILSPEFYWIKKIEAPLKSVREAKKVAANLFRLPTEEYIFDAFFYDGIYYAVALPKKLDLKIEKKFIRSIRLAQIEFFSYECINLDRGSLQKVDSILFYFPYQKEGCAHIEEVLASHELSKQTFDFYKQGVVGNKALALFAIPLLLLIALILFNAYTYHKEQLRIERSIEKLRTQYKLPLTTFELDAIAKALIKKYDKQVKIRKVLERLSQAPIERIQELHYKKGHFFVVAKTPTDPRPFFSKHFHVLKDSFANKTFEVEFTYE